jgi:hypothetical protein
MLTEARIGTEGAVPEAKEAMLDQPEDDVADLLD